MKNTFFLYLLVILLLFTLPFKFGFIGAGNEFPREVSVFIGLVELSAAVLLMIKKTRKYGALLAICIFVGAILAHIFLLGIWYKYVLFLLAILGLISSVLVFKRYR